MNIDKQETGTILNQDGSVCETKDDIKNAYENHLKNILKVRDAEENYEIFNNMTNEQF